VGGLLLSLFCKRNYRSIAEQIKGKITEIQNGFAQGHGYMDSIIFFRQLRHKCVRNIKKHHQCLYI
jgi:hypothetical protein